MNWLVFCFVLFLSICAAEANTNWLFFNHLFLATYKSICRKRAFGRTDELKILLKFSSFATLLNNYLEEKIGGQHSFVVLKLQPAVLDLLWSTIWILTTLLSIQLTADVSEKAAENEPNA